MQVSPAPKEVLDLAQEWVYRGGMRDTAFIERTSWTPDEKAIAVFTSGPNSNLSLQEFIDHLREVPPRSSDTADGEGSEGGGTASASGFVAGDTAWVTHLIKADMVYDGPVEIRCTTVLLKRDNEWKVAHCHVSEGVARDVH